MPRTLPRSAAARSAAAKGARGRGSGQAQALSRGLAVLEALASTDGGATLTALAASLDLPTPTVHRLLAALADAGFAVADTHGVWRVGVRAFRVGTAFLDHRNRAGEAVPHLSRLMEHSGETANLAVVSDGDAVYIAQVQCRELMRMNAKLGARAPLHASGVGKAILAALGEPRALALVERHGAQRFTPHTITEPAALGAELTAIRRRGYAVDDEEHAVGLRCVASALYDENGEPWGAISLAGPTSRVTRERVEALGALVRDAARDLTLALGGQAPRAARTPAPSAILEGR